MVATLFCEIFKTRFIAMFTIISIAISIGSYFLGHVVSTLRPSFSKSKKN